MKLRRIELYDLEDTKYVLDLGQSGHSGIQGVRVSAKDGLSTVYEKSNENITAYRTPLSPNGRRVDRELRIEEKSISLDQIPDGFVRSALAPNTTLSDLFRTFSIEGLGGDL